MASKSKNLSIAADILSSNISGTIRKIPLTHISPSDNQPRQNKDINIEKLSKSLKEEGLLQAIVVTKQNETNYTIIAGERRYRAAVLAGWEEIECKILNKNETDTFRLAVIENLQREELNPIEEALAYKKLKELFSYTDQNLSEVIGKSRNYISEILSIADIPEKLRTEAYGIGIRSRNLLVQYGQAVKNNRDKEFLLNYKSGKISSVKSAKNFLKSEKPKTTAETPVKQKTTQDVMVNIQSKWLNETQIHLNIKIDNIKNLNIPLVNLEGFLKKSIQDYVNSQ